MIDREYYPLDMIAKFLECTEEDLVHFAANGKIKIHLLTDGTSIATTLSDQSKFAALPKTVLVDQSYFEELEAGIDYPGLYLIIPDPNDTAKNQTVTPPFFDIGGNKTRLTKFVILHTELMKIVKKPMQPNNIGDFSESERNTMLKLIIGMAIHAYGYNPESTRNSATGDKNGISAKLRACGISISDDTVRKYLNEAKELL